MVSEADLVEVSAEASSLERSYGRIAGEVIINVRDIRPVFAASIALVVIFPLLFASMVKYSRKETVEGWLVPDQGIIRVVAREGGVLESIAVKEGALVDRGQPLAGLRLTASTGDAQDASVATERNLTAEADAQEALAALSIEQSEQKRLGILRQAASITHQIGQLDEARSRVLAQLSVSANYLERSRALASRGFVSKQRLEELQVSYLGYQREAASAQAAIEGMRAQVASLDTEAKALLNERSAIKARAAADAAQLQQRRLAAGTQNRYVITAPIAGRVAALPLQVSQVARPESTVAILIPPYSKLLAEMYVPSRAAGFIRPGQDVRVMYDSYPYEKYGVGKGTIREVSAAVLAPAEVGMPGYRGEEPVFRVRVELARTAVAADGREYPLRPGSTLKADIIIERRTLIEWLLEPLYQAKSRV